MITLEEIIKRAKGLAESSRVPEQPIKAKQGNKEVLCFIEKMGFQVNRFEVPKNDEFEACGLYYCQYKNWIFPIREIENGPLLLINPRNVKTGEKIIHYCDLTGEENSKKRVKDLIKVMNYGYDKFMEMSYSHFLNLPDVLRKKGFVVEEKKMMFELFDCDATLKINNKWYIRIYTTKDDEIQFAISNNETWSGQEERTIWGDKAYYFSYKGVQDSDELEKCMLAFEEEIKGRYGFYEEDQFFTNDYLVELIDNVQTQLMTRLYLPSNIEKKKEMSNHYQGVEIYEEFQILFDNICGKQERYTITFEYDRRKDEQYCILRIETEISKGEQGFSFSDQCELKGSFCTLYTKLRDFIWDLYEVHRINLI